MANLSTKNSKVIYTSLTGNYDKLPQYKSIDSEFDYICFSNDFEPGSHIGQWEIRPIPIVLDDKIRLSRYVKLMPHVVFPEYEWSLWLDANLVVIDTLFYKEIEKCIKNNQLWSGVNHTDIDCIYEDAKQCLKIGKVSLSEIRNQIKFLIDHKYPRHFGLYENNIILRKHNNLKVKLIDINWWDMYQQFSKRDQLSLFYIFWLNQFKPDLIFDKKTNTRNSPLIRYISHSNISFTDRLSIKFKAFYNFIMIRIVKLSKRNYWIANLV